jgi:hypothetical protein
MVDRRRYVIVMLYQANKVICGIMVNILSYFDLKKLDNIPITWFFLVQRQTKPNPSFGPFPNGLFFGA